MDIFKACLIRARHQSAYVKMAGNGETVPPSFTLSLAFPSFSLPLEKKKKEKRIIHLHFVEPLSWGNCMWQINQGLDLAFLF